MSNLSTKSYSMENSHNRVRPEAPLFSADELNGIISVDHKRNFSMREFEGGQSVVPTHW